MITVLCLEPKFLPRLIAGLPTDRETVPVDGWTGLTMNAPGSMCSVVLIEWLAKSEHIIFLRAFRRALPHHPLVLVTRPETENARSLGDVQVEEVLWISEIDTRLKTAVHRAAESREMARVAAALGAATHLPLRLREALKQACLMPCAFRSVKKLAATVGCHRATLWHQWQRSAGHCGLRLEDFLSWLVLLSALRCKRPGMSWNAVAGQLALHDRTLIRLAKRLTGSTLRELEALDPVKIQDQFSAFLTANLLTPPAPRQTGFPDRTGADPAAGASVPN